MHKVKIEFIHFCDYVAVYLQTDVSTRNHKESRPINFTEEHHEARCLHPTLTRRGTNQVEGKISHRGHMHIQSHKPQISQRREIYS